MPTVPIKSVVRDKKQPRTHFSGPEDEELMSSIETHGLLQQPVVTPDGNGKLVIVAGERRYRACKALGWTELPVTILEDVKDIRAAQLAENLQRKDLTAIEVAKTIKSLIDDHGYTQKKAGQLINKSPAYVSERLALLKLPKKVQDLVLDGHLTFSHAKLIAKAPEKDREELGKDAANNKTPVRQTKKDIDAKTNASQDSTSPGPHELVTKAKTNITRARTNINTALKHLADGADSYADYDQGILADVVEHLEQADMTLRKFLSE